MSGIKTLYLFTYNMACCVGWAAVWYECFFAIQHQKPAIELWNSVEVVLKISQTMALMEIVHAAIKLVRSPISSTFLQVASRIFALWFVANVSLGSKSHWSLIVMIMSWATVEVPRYLFYALNLFDMVPSPLFFIRYHAFMILYPSGVFGELSCMWNALPLFSTGIYSISMPNTHNIVFNAYYVLILIAIIYLPGLPVMYGHMLHQRKRAYAKKNEPKKKTA